MAWTERQRAMLQAMGLRVWPPGRAEGGAPTVALAKETPDAAPHPARPSPVPVMVPAPVPPPAPVDVHPPPAVPVHAAVASLAWPALQQAVAQCRACGLCESRRQTVFGVGSPQAHWLVIGEAPGEQEDRRGEPFVGPAGQLLDRMLAALGLTRDAEGAPPARQVYITNTLKCRPPSNRNPAPAELATCEPYLQRQIQLLQPRIILAMGRFAVQALLRSQEAIGRLRGRVHHYEGVPLIVTYHPAYLLRSLPDKARAWEDLCLAAATVEAAEPPPPPG